MGDAERPLGNVIAPGMHGHIFCSDLVTNQQSRSLRATKEKVNVVKRDLEG